MSVYSVRRKRTRKTLALCLLLTLCTLLLNACGSPQTQQQANQNKLELNKSLVNAKQVGVPANLLQPISSQEQQLDQTYAPLALFGEQSVSNYYDNLALRYAQLNIQVNGLVSQITEQFDYQASQDLQTMSNALSTTRQALNFNGTSTFANQLTTYQQQLAKAQYPKDYQGISTNAQRSIQALHLMTQAYTSLKSLQDTIKQLGQSNIDVTALKQEYASDMQSFKQASEPEALSQLMDLINTQLNETTTISAQAIPYVGQVKLNQFRDDVQLIQKYNNTNVSTYQQHLKTDQHNLDTAKTMNDFRQILTQIDSDIDSIQIPLVKAQANSLLQAFHTEVATWGSSHQYHDAFNGQSYPLDYEYDVQGIGSDLDALVQYAVTEADYQSAMDQINDNFLHLRMMEKDYSDQTASDQPHSEDLTLMNHYGITGASEILVVSLVEQTLRYYENGKLVRTFAITSGQYDKPSPPGIWQIFDRESPTLFKSSEPKGTAFWYPDTKINFAMEYHSGGYFFHDSWWRVNYGVGTNFPHNDTGGDESFAGNGSHGCINMAESDIAWLYPHSTYNAQVILY